MSIESKINFCIKLFKVLDSDNDIVYSPASILSVLSMIYAGTDGIAADEIANIIGTGKSFAEIIEYYSGLMQYYKAVNKINENNDDDEIVEDDEKFPEKFKLLFSNCLFLSEKPLMPSFKETMKKFEDRYQQVDFMDATKSAKAINDFVAENTNGKISEIIKSDEISEKTSLFIVNALYFIGKWEKPFEEVKEQTFHSNPPRKIPMISQDSSGMDWNFNEGEEWQCLGIPYKFRRSWLHILLPKKKNGLKELKESLDYSLIQKCVESNPVDCVKATIPIFKIETKTILNDKLKKIGLQQIFEGYGITKMFEDQHFLDVAVHAAKIEVDRNGTYGSAATACGIKINADFEEIKFIADHPFMFFITLTEEENNPENIKTVLLMGTYF